MAGRLFLRALVIVGGGYAVSAALVAAGSALLPLIGVARSDAYTLCGMLGFLLYLAFAVWATAGGGWRLEATFRQSLHWLHTWTGVVLGALLFAVFWTGTLCVFDRDIDRWMMPSTRLVYDGAPVSLDPLLPEVDKLPPGVAWAFIMPTAREPFVWLATRAATGFEKKMFDPATLRPLPDPGTWGATRFFFPFHYMLHINAWNIGTWLVGLAGMAMLALSVSGVVIHRRIIADFFTIRRSRQPHRLLLDIHNTAGTLGLVFYFVMAFSGLTIFVATFFPPTWGSFEGDRRAYVFETFDNYARPKVGQPGPPLASLDKMIATATREWGGVPPILVRIWHYGDANATVEMRPSVEAEVKIRTDPIYFDGATGAVLYRSTMRPTTALQQYITGLHFAQFRHWPLRWIYFGLGLLGCVLIATGFLFWLESRRKAHEAAGLPGVRIVEGLAIGSTTGLIVATLSFFVANRLLPSGAAFLGTERYALEIWTFCLVWLAAFAHAWTRSRTAWREQCWAAAALALSAVVLNWITTGNHTIAVTGVDAVLLAGAMIAAVTAQRRGSS